MQGADQRGTAHKQEKQEQEKQELKQKQRQAVADAQKVTAQMFHLQLFKVQDSATSYEWKVEDLQVIFNCIEAIGPGPSVAVRIAVMYCLGSDVQFLNRLVHSNQQMSAIVESFRQGLVKQKFHTDGSVLFSNVTRNLKVPIDLCSNICTCAETLMARASNPGNSSYATIYAGTFATKWKGQLSQIVNNVVVGQLVQDMEKQKKHNEMQEKHNEKQQKHNELMEKKLLVNEVMQRPCVKGRSQKAQDAMKRNFEQVYENDELKMISDPKNPRLLKQVVYDSLSNLSPESSESSSPEKYLDVIRVGSEPENVIEAAKHLVSKVDRGALNFYSPSKDFDSASKGSGARSSSGSTQAGSGVGSATAMDGSEMGSEMDVDDPGEEKPWVSTQEVYWK